MDPVSLIVTALAAGNARRPPDTTGPGAAGPGATAVQNAYACLWSRVRRALAGRPDGAMMLSRHAEAPQTWAAPLMAALRAAGAADDAGLVAAAAELLRLTGQNGYLGAGHGAAQGAHRVQP